MTGLCQDLKMMTIMTDLHFTESISYVDCGTGVRPTPAASTIGKVNIIITLFCGKILELEFVPILYEC